MRGANSLPGWPDSYHEASTQCRRPSSIVLDLECDRLWAHFCRYLAVSHCSSYVWWRSGRSPLLLLLRNTVMHPARVDCSPQRRRKAKKRPPGKTLRSTSSRYPRTGRATELDPAAHFQSRCHSSAMNTLRAGLDCGEFELLLRPRQPRLRRSCYAGYLGQAPDRREPSSPSTVARSAAAPEDQLAGSSRHRNANLRLVVSNLSSLGLRSSALTR